MKKILCLLSGMISGFMLMIHVQDYIHIDTSFYSQVLDEVKMVDVYLPDDYYSNPDTQYAVIYYLHGAGGNQNSGMTEAALYYFQHDENTTLTSPPAIFVVPEGSCDPYMGSMYVNSVLYGNYEDFIMEDVMAFIESSFQAIADKNFRFITGLSMGGGGAGWLAVRHPDRFRATFPYIGFLSWPDTTKNCWRDNCYQENGSFVLTYNAGIYTNLMFTGCGGYSPNMDLPPDYVEFLWDSAGNWVDTVLAKWDSFDISRRVHSLPDENELAWFLGCGRQDEMVTFPTYQVFMDSMDAYGRKYDTCFFDGGHVLHTPTWKVGMQWMDSIINRSFLTVGSGMLSAREGSLELYPNPARMKVMITYKVKEEGNVSLAIYDLQGQRVKELLNTLQQKGEYNVPCDVSGLPTGIYICRLMTGNLQEIKKLVKL